jgi:uncharacterized membrane protein
MGADAPEPSRTFKPEPRQQADVLGALGDLIGPPAIVVTLLVAMAMLLVAATTGGAAGQVLAVFVAVAAILAALAMTFFVWLKRANADISSHRADLRDELDAMVEDDEE